MTFPIGGLNPQEYLAFNEADNMLRMHLGGMSGAGNLNGNTSKTAFPGEGGQIRDIYIPGISGRKKDSSIWATIGKFAAAALVITGAVFSIKYREKIGEFFKDHFGGGLSWCFEKAADFAGWLGDKFQKISDWFL